MPWQPSDPRSEADPVPQVASGWLQPGCTIPPEIVANNAATGTTQQVWRAGKLWRLIARRSATLRPRLRWSFSHRHPRTCEPFSGRRDILVSAADQGRYPLSGDAVSVAPNVYSVIFENERVRVLDVRANPGSESPMHSHPDSVMYAASAAEILVTTPDGEEHLAEVSAGATFWNPATEHAVRNVGSTPVHFIRIELK